MAEGGEGAREIWSLEFYHLEELESSIGRSLANFRTGGRYQYILAQNNNEKH
jgi:hypothetical protein